MFHVTVSLVGLPTTSVVSEINRLNKYLTDKRYLKYRR